MRKITARNVLLLIGVSVFALMAATRPVTAKEASARARAEIAKSTHYSYARNWKRHHRAYKVSRRLVRPRAYDRVYIPRSYPWPSRNYETELLLQCLMTQPFVDCP